MAHQTEWINSSDTDGDTVPFTPEDKSEIFGDESQADVFALIRPCSPSACEAFDALVNVSIKHREN